MFKALLKKIVSLFKSRLFIAGLAAAALMAVLIARLVSLQLINGRNYLDTFTSRVKRELPIQSQRGNIFDRNGRLLAGSRTAYHVVLKDSETLKDNKSKNEMLFRLISMLESCDCEPVNYLPITIDESGRYIFSAQAEAVSTFKRNIFALNASQTMTNAQQSMDAEGLMRYMCSNALFGIDDSYKKGDRLSIAALRYELFMKRYTKYLPVTICKDIPDTLVAKISENAAVLPGVSIQESDVRTYEDSLYFAHITGYMGEISEEELESFPEDRRNTYTPGDMIGKTGIEKLYDEALSGRKGVKTIYVDSLGREIETSDVTAAVSGNDVYLSIDKELQIKVYELLEEKLAGIILSRFVERTDEANNPNWLISIETLCQALIKNHMIDAEDTDISDYQSLLCLLAEQGVLKKDSAYRQLKSGALSPYDYLFDKIYNLEITPEMLALDTCQAACVVTDPGTGKVLALVSYPGYDANRIRQSSYYSALLNNCSAPLYNRATQQAIAPGSTFKPVGAAAGLEEDYITPDEVIEDQITFKKVAPPASCWSKTGHGNINVSQALSVSCNYFFYELGYRFGLDASGNFSSSRGLITLSKYASKFGLDKKSGIELEEGSPHVSDEDLIRSMIGQGTHSYTPVVLARYMSVIASRGNVYRLSLMDRITDEDGTVISGFPADTLSKLHLKERTWDAIYSGLEDVLNSSAYGDVFKSLGVLAAGKSGTAQDRADKPDHSLFTGFAPLEHPEYCVTVVIPNGYGSANVADTFRDVLAACFNKPFYKPDRDSAGRHHALMPYNYTTKEAYLDALSDE